MATTLLNELDLEATTASMILILGQTGAGKSHFINRLLGENTVKESAKLQSCTSRPELVEATVDSKSFLLIDTPGFNDTWRDFKRSDTQILDEIARTLTAQTELGVRLRGILYLYDIMQTRMTGDTRRQLEMIKRICGPDNYENVMLVTTRWPRDIETQQSFKCPTREAGLRREFWKDMIEGGSKMWRFDDTRASAKAIIRTLGAKGDVTLALQHEMAQGRTLQNTTAGSFIVQARIDDEQRIASNSRTPGVEGTSALLEELRHLQESIDKRKHDEEQLEGDLIEKVRAEIKERDQEMKKENRRATVANILNWLIGAANFAVGIANAAMGT